MTTVGVKGLWTAGHTDREKDSAKHVDTHLLTYVILRLVYALSHCVVVTDSVTVIGNSIRNYSVTIFIRFSGAVTKPIIIARPHA